ncbi:MAG: hypothetical protein DRJ51_02360 [Thermoprotei archaeon]|nr:MAG: hypothetical protein DRJ51_02360 [Thermoprotei archaeon]RLF02540.1 MAG: hypothetical protein DRJ59_03330 [Thermoprotei archaeon]
MARREEDLLVKYMAQLLKAGATMLSENCPACKTPLLKLKSGEVICPRCKRRVFIVKDEREEAELKRNLLLEYTKDVLYEKIEEYTDFIRKEADTTKLSEYLVVMIRLLECLERIRKVAGESR